MEKIINYTLGIDGAFPEEEACGGVQGEHKATALKFEPDYELKQIIDEYKAGGTEITVKIDAVTLSGEIAASEKRNGEDLFAPFYLTGKVTVSGLDTVVVVRILAEDKEICKAQIKLFFTPSPIALTGITGKSKNEELSDIGTEIIEELSKKAKETTEIIDKKAAVVKASAESAARHLKQIENISEENLNNIIEFTEGTTVVFAGGDAKTRIQTADETLSETSQNPVQNKAVTKGIKQAKQEVLAEINTIAEYGKSGIWHYEKWSNGILKCYGELTVSVRPETEWGGGHYYALVNAVEFPNMFVNVPQLTVSVEDEGANFLVTKRSTSVTDTGALYILSLEPFSTNMEVRLSFALFGRWKEEVE